MKKILQILFVVIALLGILENFFIAGLFTGIAMLLAILILGCMNMFRCAFDREWNSLALYGIVTLSIAMSYLRLL